MLIHVQVLIHVTDAGAGMEAGEAVGAGAGVEAGEGVGAGAGEEAREGGPSYSPGYHQFGCPAVCVCW